MYFLLSQCFFIDMMYVSTTVTKMSTDILTNSKTITFLGCEIQTVVLLALGGTEARLPGFMSYDRNVAICHPLHYPVLMSKNICWFMVTCAWASDSINALVHTLYVFHLSFCRSWLINHFFSEVPSLLPLVCQDTSQYEHIILPSEFIVLLLPLMAILASYTCVFTEMNSGKGQRKAISTRSSQIIVASLFYVTGLSTSTRPHSLHSPELDKAGTMLHTIITPLLKLFIYSLRNKEVIGPMRQQLI
ncbi:unnamed protein product [Gulo gulo]|uniref:G-protein coupled receptors family 1 profile domain-containing protein n=1 Tax=Gulo gulo TaxID=48420 RepID=A0A9X9LLL3_GULGU|nr:unnamed protein product [Gulo gulo]